MTSSSSTLVDNLSEGIHSIKCKYGHYNKKCETCRIKYKDYECCLKYTKAFLILYKFLCCNKNYQKSLMKILKRDLLIRTHFLTMI